VSGHPCRCGHSRRLHRLDELECLNARCWCRRFRPPGSDGPTQLQLAPIAEQQPLLDVRRGCEHAAPNPCAACVSRVRPLGGDR
jgi:hypothetical protein